MVPSFDRMVWRLFPSKPYKRNYKKCIILLWKNFLWTLSVMCIRSVMIIIMMFQKLTLSPFAGREKGPLGLWFRALNAVLLEVVYMRTLDNLWSEMYRPHQHLPPFMSYVILLCLPVLEMKLISIMAVKHNHDLEVCVYCSWSAVPFHQNILPPCTVVTHCCYSKKQPILCPQPTTLLVVGRVLVVCYSGRVWQLCEVAKLLMRLRYK
jgi:hypothetical protein